MVELDNGCICCSLRPNMVKEVKRLCAKKGRFDYIVVESSGICEPMPIAEAFTDDDDDDDDDDAKEKLNTKDVVDALSQLARVDTMCTVVDSSRFWEYLNSMKSLIEHYGKQKIDDSEEGKRSIAELLVDQVEFANVVVVNKLDLLESKPEQIKQVQDIVTLLNPSAKMISTSYSKINPKEILSTGRFNISASMVGARWAKELAGGADEGKSLKTKKEASTTIMIIIIIIIMIINTSMIIITSMIMGISMGITMASSRSSIDEECRFTPRD
eukprot:CAMPEP_0167808578 /NCGR_PEP_ID=MMETSP0111_2-20121227/23278_1 /TAXON_ID=91324 /ORGANISM="Lotharella globosa, Strain CCCM811" /LENGTH=270 /DNA_ID=CAMNT_0007706791 /DNA_START=12 /DNA_END=825 /DNA_ORIENTATION=+